MYLIIEDPGIGRNNYLRNLCRITDVNPHLFHDPAPGHTQIVTSEYVDIPKRNPLRV